MIFLYQGSVGYIIQQGEDFKPSPYAMTQFMQAVMVQ